MAAEGIVLMVIITQRQNITALCIGC